MSISLKKGGEYSQMGTITGTASMAASAIQPGPNVSANGGTLVKTISSFTPLATFHPLEEFSNILAGSQQKAGNSLKSSLAGVRAAEVSKLISRQLVSNAILGRALLERGILFSATA